MQDLLYVALTAAFFAAAWGLTLAFERLERRKP